MLCRLLQRLHRNVRMSGVIKDKAGAAVDVIVASKDTAVRILFRRTGAPPMILLTLLFRLSSTGSAMRKGIDQL